MKIVNKKRALKLIGIQLALLVALVITQIGMQFATSYHWVGFEKKDGDNWYSVAMNAQAYNSNCQIDLVKANEQLEDFRKLRDSENADIK